LQVILISLHVQSQRAGSVMESATRSHQRSSRPGSASEPWQSFVIWTSRVSNSMHFTNDQQAKATGHSQVVIHRHTWTFLCFVHPIFVALIPSLETHLCNRQSIRLLARAAMDCDKGTRLGELLGFRNFHAYNRLQRITMKRNWSKMC